MNGLYLSGGSVKGAYQAGAILKLAETGFVPDIIKGTSVGSLNGLFLVNNHGKTGDFKTAAEELAELWLTKITSPKSIAKKRSYVKLAYQVIFSKFDGYMSTEPLFDLINENVNIANLLKSNIDYWATTVSMETGRVEYKHKSDDRILKWVLSSASMPLIMNGVNMDNKHYFDGGLVDIIPLQTIMEKENVKDLVVISCQGKDISVNEFNDNKAVKLLERTLEILLGEIVRNDIKEFYEKKNSNIMQTSNNIRLIRPNIPIEVSISNFDKDDIKRMFDLGYSAEIEVLNTTNFKNLI